MSHILILQKDFVPLSREKVYSGMSKIKYLLCVLIMLTEALLTEGCSTFYDDLRKCYEVTLEYRYIPATKDEYPRYIKGMRHFLFNQDGFYLCELSQNPISPQILTIKELDKGSYTVVTLGNCSTENTLLMLLEFHQTLLSDFILQLKRRASQQEAYANAEELFWNAQSFEITGKGAQHITCDLANIHCHLFFEVSWQSVPPADGKYQIELSNLTEAYALDPAQSPLSIKVNTKKRVVHSFPLHSKKTHRMYQEVPLFYHRLTGEFISLRYKNDRIPTFQIKKDGKAITKPLDLASAFRAFSWIPDQRAEQIYRIQIRINDDESVTIRPWYDGSVEDWQVGGTVAQ